MENTLAERRFQKAEFRHKKSGFQIENHFLLFESKPQSEICVLNS